MLKECYYQDQTNFDRVDYVYLHRFIDRMIQYRNAYKGSYDGKKRIEEIKNIDLNRVSYNTKLILLFCIKRHDAKELLLLPNLKELNDIEDREISQHKELEFFRGEESMSKLRVEDFLENIKKLNNEIKRLIQNGELPLDYVFEIRCIGGFAMAYYKLRDGGMTEDMDSLVEIHEKVKETIKAIARKEELPLDWINDTMLNFYTDSSRFEWVEVPWFLGRDARIKIYVCSKEELLRNKIRFAESYLNKVNYQDRDCEIDYLDSLALLHNLGIGTGVNPSFAKVKLEEMRIYQKYYPKMFAMILGEDYLEDEEYYLFKSMIRVEKKEESFEEFERIVDSNGLTLEDVRNYYSMYIDEFRYFKDEMMKRIPSK